MSPVCVLDIKYEPRVDDRLENIKRGVIFFHLEHIMGDMNYFLNRYTVKTKQKPHKNRQFDAIKNMTS